MEQNMFIIGIRSTWHKILEVKGNVLVCCIEIITLLCILLLLIILSPLGLLPIITSSFWKIVLKYRDEIKKVDSFWDAAPLTVAMTIFFILLVPFFVFSLPMYIIGFLGYLFSGNENEGDKSS